MTARARSLSLLHTLTLSPSAATTGGLANKGAAEGAIGFETPSGMKLQVASFLAAVRYLRMPLLVGNLLAIVIEILIG
jgi:hypothetical protein